MDGVIDVLPKVSAGQTIGKGGTTAQQIVSVWLKAKDWEAFDALATKIKTILRIEDENGCSLIKV